MSSVIKLFEACGFIKKKQKIESIAKNEVKELLFNIPYIEYDNINNKIHIGFIVKYLEIVGSDKGSYILLDYLSTPIKGKVVSSELIPFDNVSLKLYANKCNISYEDCVARLFTSGFMLKQKYYNLLK